MASDGYSRQAADVAPILAVLSAVLYCFNGELLQALQSTHTSSTRENSHGSSPLVNLFLCHIGGLVFIPYFMWKPQARPDVLKVSTGSIAFAAIIFTLLLTGYNYMWLLSSTFVPAGLTNAVFQSSIALVFLASVVLFNEKFSLPRLFGVVLAIIGSLLASGITAEAGQANLSAVAPGVLFALGAAVGYAGYQVLFRYWFGHLKSDVCFLMYFGAWVAVMHFVIVLPIIAFADKVGFEKCQMPLGETAILGTVLSAIVAFAVNGLYLCLVMWGSAMLLPCASALSVPLGVALDMGLHGLHPSLPEVAGHSLVVLSFLLIMDISSSAPQKFVGKFKKDSRQLSPAAFHDDGL